MRVIILRTLLILTSILIPPLVIGYVNWDITFISTIPEWGEGRRVLYGVVSILVIVLAVGVAFTAIEEKQ